MVITKQEKIKRAQEQINQMEDSVVSQAQTLPLQSWKVI